MSWIRARPYVVGYLIAIATASFVLQIVEIVR